MRAIAKMEGFFIPGTKAARNHNPGNLRASSLATGKDSDGLAIFPDDETGWRALARQITLDAKRGKTIEQFISGYAPKADGNDPNNYLSFVCAQTGMQATDKLSQLA